MGRASPPLLFGLAPRGVCRAVSIARDAVGSYPTFSPLPSTMAREDLPEVFLGRVAEARSHRRYILCGTFRSRLLQHPDKSGRRIRRPPGVTRRVALQSPDFPPAVASCDAPASDHPSCPPTPLYRLRATNGEGCAQIGNRRKGRLLPASGGMQLLRRKRKRTIRQT